MFTMIRFPFFCGAIALGLFSGAASAELTPAPAGVAPPAPTASPTPPPEGVAPPAPTASPTPPPEGVAPPAPAGPIPAPPTPAGVVAPAAAPTQSAGINLGAAVPNVVPILSALEAIPDALKKHLDVAEQYLQTVRVQDVAGNERNLTATERKTILLDYVRGTKDQSFLRWVGAQTHQTVTSLSKDDTAKAEAIINVLPGLASVATVVAAPGGAPGTGVTLPPAGSTVITPDQLRAVRDHLAKVDDYLRTVSIADAAGHDSPLGTALQKEELLNYVQGRKNKSFFSFVQKLTGKIIDALSDADLAQIKPIIDDVVARSVGAAPGPVAQPSRPPAPAQSPGALLGEVVSVVDDVAGIVGVPGLTQFETLASDVVTLVESPAFAGLFQRCRTWSAGRRASRSLNLYP